MIIFSSKTDVVISEDLTKDLRDILRRNGIKNAALIVDFNISGHRDIKKTAAELRKDIRLHVQKVIPSEPTTDMVNKYTLLLRKKKIDMFIGIGGGSILDLTKALSVMVVNGGKVEDYHGTGKEFAAGTRKVMVPTTAGTGSEVTPGAVLVNKATKFKRAISGRYISPDYAILNAKLTLSMPDFVIASTGMDALGHAIESYTAKNSSVITRMFSRQAFSLVYNNLPKIFSDKSNIELRRKVLLGSCFAGFAIHNSNTGACHAMAYPLGIYNGIPHGVGVAKLLPKVVKINVEKGCYLYADLYDLMEGAKMPYRKEKKSMIFSELLERYRPLKHVVRGLSYYGVNEKNYIFLAESGLDLKSALGNNPVDFSISDSIRVLRETLREEGKL